VRLDPHLPVVAVALFAAAAAQDLIPVTVSLPAKLPFLTAVGLYLALTKPVSVALTSLVWAGLLTDALGGLPLFCTAGFLLLAYGAVRILQRWFLEATFIQGTVLTACAALLQMVWTRAWVKTGAVFFSWQTLSALGWSALVGGIAGGAGFAICGWLDRISGNVKPVKEGNGILWAETAR
jgi:cell shape-determining protein MreD